MLKFLKGVADMLRTQIEVNSLCKAEFERDVGKARDKDGAQKKNN